MARGIHQTAQVAKGAVLGEGVEIGPYSIIGPQVVLGPNCIIGAHVTLKGRVEMGADNVVYGGAIIGQAPQDRNSPLDIDTGVKIGQANIIREYVTIHRASLLGGATIIGDNNMLMANVHIAHDCILGNNINIANLTALAGFVEIGDGAFLSAFCGVHQFCRIGSLAMLGGFSKVQKDLVPFALANGQPALIHGLNLVGLRRQGMAPERRKELKKAFKYLFASNLNTQQALLVIEKELGHVPECLLLLDFIKASKRGIIKKTARGEEE